MKLRIGLGLASLPLYLILAVYYADVAKSLRFSVEHYATLKLPGPSFKGVGPPFTLRPLAEHKGVFTNTDVLHKAQILFKDQILGSECVAANKNGDLYMLDRYGVVWESSPGGNPPNRLGHLGGGRPLGFQVDEAGNLIVCNAASGLHLLERATQRNILLATEAPASKNESDLTSIRFANGLATASDRSIYFTDSSVIPINVNEAGFYDTMTTFILDLLQGDKTGRLLKYDPKSGKTSLLLGGLHFANGVALGPNEEFVLVVQSTAVTVTRLWLKGPKAGQQDTFIDHLPGYPDGITEGSGETYWLSLVSLKNPALEMLVRSRIIRWLAPRLPASDTKSGTAIVQLSAEGKVLRYLDDADGSHLSSISAVIETASGLYFGNVAGNFVSFLKKSDLPTPAAS